MDHRGARLSADSSPACARSRRAGGEAHRFAASARARHDAGAVPYGHPSAASAAEAALDYLRRRRQLLVRLERVAGALRRWDAWEANARLAEARRRPVVRPVLDREALVGLHEMLSEELARLDGSRHPAG